MQLVTPFTLVENKCLDCLTNMSTLLASAKKQDKPEFLHQAKELLSNFHAQKRVAEELSEKHPTNAKLKQAAEQLPKLASDLVSIAEQILANPTDKTLEGDYNALTLVAARCLGEISNPLQEVEKCNKELTAKLTELSTCLKAQDVHTSHNALPVVRNLLDKKVALTRLEADLKVCSPFGKVQLLRECRTLEEGNAALPSLVLHALENGKGLQQAVEVITTLPSVALLNPRLLNSWRLWVTFPCFLLLLTMQPTLARANQSLWKLYAQQ